MLRQWLYVRQKCYGPSPVALEVHLNKLLSSFYDRSTGFLTTGDTNWADCFFMIMSCCLLLLWLHLHFDFYVPHKFVNAFLSCIHTASSSSAHVSVKGILLLGHIYPIKKGGGGNNSLEWWWCCCKMKWSRDDLQVIKDTSRSHVPYLRGLKMVIFLSDYASRRAVSYSDWGCFRYFSKKPSLKL